MAVVAQFSRKLELVLKALSLSRGRLAADLGVDKSLVGRWASGAVNPSEHNLSNLTRLIAGRQPGFTMLDWDRDLGGLGRVFGVDIAAFASTALIHADPAQRPATHPIGVPLPILEAARSTTLRRGAAYEGFWRSTRPSVIMPGRFFNEHGMIRIGDEGLLHFRMGGAGLLFDGWIVPAEGQLFAILFDMVGMTPVFVSLNGTPLPKAFLVDGLLMASSLNTTRTPSAYPIILERIGDLSGDPAADDAECEALMGRNSLAPEDAIPDHIRDHLIRDIGPEAAKSGGDLFLSAARTMSRGATLGGQLTG
jgi:transcriptional regulator with XRE-family HTH domain